MIKAIETEYNGYKFRSRLEARWAVFFDALKVKYEYEPEGYVLDDGTMYLPDFRIKCYGTHGGIDEKPFDLWIEVKGIMTHSDAEKIKKFAMDGKIAEMYPIEGGYVKNPILVLGDIPHGDGTEVNWERDDDTGVPFFNHEFIDEDWWGAYPFADEFGHFYLAGADSNQINREDIPRVKEAYNKARQARFEHGEKPIF